MIETIVGGTIAGLILLLVPLVGGAFSLPLARRLRLSWVRLITRRKPPSARAAKLAETESYLHEMVEDLRRQEYSTSQIALHVMFDLARSMPADVTWRPHRAERDIAAPASAKALDPETESQILHLQILRSHASIEASIEKIQSDREAIGYLLKNTRVFTTDLEPDSTDQGGTQ